MGPQRSSTRNPILGATWFIVPSTRDTRHFARLFDDILERCFAPTAQAQRGAAHGQLTAGRGRLTHQTVASSASGQRGRTSKVPSVVPWPRPRCQRSAAANAIIAPLSVHSASGG